MNKSFISIGIAVIAVTGIFAQTSITTRNDLPAGLRNVNPDPNGEPWLVGGMKATPEALEILKNIPEWPGPRGLSKVSAAPALPDHVYNHQNPEFPPTFSQIGNCCSAASGIGYCYTYESNVLKGTAATTADNLCAYGFLYDFLDNGADQGCWYYDAWNIAKKTGCFSKTDFGNTVEDAGSGGLKESKWGTGYTKYHNAYATCRDSAYYKIKVGDAAGLAKLKQWMFDHGRGDKKGGVAVFSWFASHTFSPIPAGMPDAGKKIITSVSGQEVTEHAMTFAGYDDRIGPSGTELGALLLQNSWGKSYGDAGRCWVPYRYLRSSDAIWNNQVYVIEVRKHTVKLDYKVSITHDKRNQLQIKIGFANSAGAAAAATTSLIGGAAAAGGTSALAAFNYCGGPYPMEGNGGSSTIELGLDATDLYETMTGGEATFFLIVTSKGGTGSIGGFSLMDYSGGGAPCEFPSSQKNTTLPIGTTTMSISYKKPATAMHSAFTAPCPEHEIKVLGRSGKYSMYLPFDGMSTVTVKDLRGRVLSSLVTNDRGWFDVPRHLPTGMHVALIVNNGRTYQGKMNVVK